MAIATLVVSEVVSPGTVRGDDDRLYVLRGVPDVEEGFVHFEAARALVDRFLGGKELSFDEETARELSELPGLDIVALDSHGAAVTPTLAALVAGVLSGHPLREHAA